MLRIISTPPHVVARLTEVTDGTIKNLSKERAL